MHEKPNPQRHHFMRCRCHVTVKTKDFNVVIMERFFLTICLPTKIAGICDEQRWQFLSVLLL